MAILASRLQAPLVLRGSYPSLAIRRSETAKTAFFTTHCAGGTGFFIAKPGSNTPQLAAFGSAGIVGLKGLNLRNLSAAGGQVSFVNRARPAKKMPHLLAAGSFIAPRYSPSSEPRPLDTMLNHALRSLFPAEIIAPWLYKIISLCRICFLGEFFQHQDRKVRKGKTFLLHNLCGLLLKTFGFIRVDSWFGFGSAALVLSHGISIGCTLPWVARNSVSSSWTQHIPHRHRETEFRTTSTTTQHLIPDYVPDLCGKNPGRVGTMQSPSPLGYWDKTKDCSDSRKPQTGTANPEILQVPLVFNKTGSSLTRFLLVSMHSNA